MDIYTVIIADDHVIFRKGLITVLNEIPNIKVIGEASDGRETLKLLKKNKTDIVFMDINMPVMNGIDATKKIKEINPETAIIALTMHEEISYFNSMLEAGADAFVLKRTTKDELQEAINTVMQGNYYYSKEFIGSLNITPPQKKNKKIELTAKEKEVLKYICKGFSNNEIGKKMYLSPKTVEGYRTKLMDKTGAKNAANLVMYAMKNNLVDL